MLGPVAVNTMAPDEGNMYLIGKIGSPAIKERFLAPLIAGEARSAFFMTEPATDGGAGSDPSMMKTTAVRDGDHWVVNGRSEEHTSELQSLMRISYAVFCLKKKKKNNNTDVHIMSNNVTRI